MMKKCDHCGGKATKEGHAFPGGGSFPVVGCDQCLKDLAEVMGVSVKDIE